MSDDRKRKSKEKPEGFYKDGTWGDDCRQAERENAIAGQFYPDDPNNGYTKIFGLEQRRGTSSTTPVNLNLNSRLPLPRRQPRSLLTSLRLQTTLP
eukprot:SAG25_NODE_8_length_29132_cov_108.213895_25_plen_96_part_00